MGKNRMTVYSVNEVKVTVGVYPVDSGRSDGDFVAISQTEERYVVKQGPDSEATRSDTGAVIHRIVISVTQTSRANAYFSALHKGDIAAIGGAGIVPLAVVDIGGKDVFVTKSAWIVKWPDQKKAKESGIVDWEFDCHDPEVFIGGH